MLIRNEYPRPQFRRDQWLPLNGQWQFCFDDDNQGEKLGYATGKVQLKGTINVPFSYQYPASGIGTADYHPYMWYRRTFEITNKSKRAMLCFNGVDYACKVWINGHFAIANKGAYKPFDVDVTNLLKKGTNTIVVQCHDPLDPTIPRGKQSWTGEKFGCWYVPNSGIWQSVFIHFFQDDAIAYHTIVPNIDTCSFGGEIVTLRGLADEAKLTVSYQGKVVKTQQFSLDGKHTRYTVNLMELDFVDESFLWSPDRPNLFYVDFALLRGNKVVDLAHTRFGMRKISVDSQGQIVLNNAPFYQRLVLDQGYWEQSGITPPSVDALKQDIQLAKQMGFNGARKHQKIEDPYFAYLAEELGFVTWCEMPSAYNFCQEEMVCLMDEWQCIVGNAINQTSTIAYAPLNESWGVRKILHSKQQQDFAKSLYYVTKAMDSSRLVSTNDGWENVDASDILSIHDYAFSGDHFPQTYTAENVNKLYPQPRKLMAENNTYKGTPMLFSEFGGIAMQTDATNGNWGYNSAANNVEEFFARYQNLLASVYATPAFQGFCYTQLTDVQQEVNGLLDANHQPKFDLERICKATANTK